MKTSNSSRAEDAKLTTTVLELTAACPMGEAEPSCILKEVRLQSAPQRKRWVDGLTKREKQQIVAAHERCSSSREAAASAKKKKNH